MVKISTRAAVRDSTVLVACSPSIRGIRMSISTTSGCSATARSIASTPSAASPTTSMPPAVPMITRNPVRTRRWSSAIRSRIGAASAWSTAASSMIMCRSAYGVGSGPVILLEEDSRPATSPFLGTRPGGLLPSPCRWIRVAQILPYGDAPTLPGAADSCHRRSTVVRSQRQESIMTNLTTRPEAVTRTGSGPDRASAADCSGSDPPASSSPSD